MPDLISGLVGALVELFCVALGQRLLSLFGWRQPHQIASFLTGMAFWIGVALLAYVTVSG